jgi:cytochrome b
MHRRNLTTWLLANIGALLVLPVVYTVLLRRQIALEYTNGIRVSTDSDSITIPIVGFVVNLTVVLVIVNIAGIALVRLRRRRIVPSN